MIEMSKKNFFSSTFMCICHSFTLQRYALVFFFSENAFSLSNEKTLLKKDNNMILSERHQISLTVLSLLISPSLSADLSRRRTLPTRWGDTAAPEPVLGQLLRGVFPATRDSDRRPAGRERGQQLNFDPLSSPGQILQHNMQQIFRSIPVNPHHLLSNLILAPMKCSTCMCKKGLCLHPFSSSRGGCWQGNQSDRGWINLRCEQSCLSLINGLVLPLVDW